MERIGRWAFLAGLILAAASGVGIEESWPIWVLASLGVVVGLLNVTGEETTNFLLSAIALLVSASAVASIPLIGAITSQIIARLVTFVAAALLVVALQTLFVTAKDR